MKGAGRPCTLGEGLSLERQMPGRSHSRAEARGTPPAGSGLALGSWVPGLGQGGLGLGEGAALAPLISTPTSFTLDPPTLALGPLAVPGPGPRETGASCPALAEPRQSHSSASLLLLRLLAGSWPREPRHLFSHPCAL